MTTSSGLVPTASSVDFVFNETIFICFTKFSGHWLTVLLLRNLTKDISHTGPGSTIDIYEYPIFPVDFIMLSPKYSIF